MRQPLAWPRLYLSRLRTRRHISPSQHSSQCTCRSSFRRGSWPLGCRLATPIPSWRGGFPWRCRCPACRPRWRPSSSPLEALWARRLRVTLLLPLCPTLHLQCLSPQPSHNRELPRCSQLPPKPQLQLRKPRSPVQPRRGNLKTNTPLPSMLLRPPSPLEKPLGLLEVPPSPLRKPLSLLGKPPCLLGKPLSPLERPQLPHEPPPLSKGPTNKGL